MPAKPLTTHGSVDAVACARPRVRHPGLDLLRALAIVLVVLYHGGIFGFTLPGDVQRFGWVGVDLFFVLSGYLIGGQLLAPLASGKRLDLPRFFGQRALRILPAYLVVLGVYAALPGWREYPSMPPTWRFLTFVQNLGLHGGTAFSHAWSLPSCKLSAYIFPVVFLAGPEFSQVNVCGTLFQPVLTGKAERAQWVRRAGLLGHEDQPALRGRHFLPEHVLARLQVHFQRSQAGTVTCPDSETIALT